MTFSLNVQRSQAEKKKQQTNNNIGHAAVLIFVISSLTRCLQPELCVRPWRGTLVAVALGPSSVQSGKSF